MSSKHVKTSDSFIFGGRMECVNPNLRMLSCSDVRLWEDRLVTVSSDERDRLVAREVFELLVVCLNELCGCSSPYQALL